MPCFYYSPNANASTKLENVPFTEAELGAHVLRMCSIQWQEQYNMNKKGMTPMDMCSLLTSLEAFKRVCTYEKGKLDSYKKFEKSSNKGEKGKKRPGTSFLARCKKHGGAHTTHVAHDCHRFEKDGKETSNFCTTKECGYKSNPVNQNFAQLMDKIKKLEKALKKSGKKGQKRRYKDSDSDSE
jgi:hypothetical protein